LALAVTAVFDATKELCF